MPRGQAEQLTTAICLSTHLGLKLLALSSLLISFLPLFSSICTTVNTKSDTWPAWQDRSRSCAPCQRWWLKSAGALLPKEPQISAAPLSYVRPGPGSQSKSSARVLRSLWFLFRSRMMNRGAWCQLACPKLFTQILHQSVVWQLDGVTQSQATPRHATGVYLLDRLIIKCPTAISIELV